MKVRNKIHICCIILAIGFVYTCKPKAKSDPQDINQDIQLEGTWYLNREELYNKLYFQDSIHLALDTHIDTMFFYKYSLEGDTLCLYDDYGELINHNIILKLDQDSLIFANLLDKAGIQRYSRSKTTVEATE